MKGLIEKYASRWLYLSVPCLVMTGTFFTSKNPISERLIIQFWIILLSFLMPISYDFWSSKTNLVVHRIDQYFVNRGVSKERAALYTVWVVLIFAIGFGGLMFLFSLSQSTATLAGIALVSVFIFLPAISGITQYRKGVSNA